MQYKVQKTGPEEAAECGLLQSKRPQATVQDLVSVNKMVGRMKARADRCLPIHSHVGPSLVVICWEDAAFGNRPDGSSTAGYVVGVSTPDILHGEEALVTFADWGSHKIHQMCRSAAAAEARSMTDSEDNLSAIRYMLAEALGLARPGEDSDTVVSKIQGCMVTDSKNCYDNLLKNCAFLGMKEKMVGIDLKTYQQRCVMRQTPTRWVHGDAMLANSLTKIGEPQQLELYFAKGGRYRLTYDPTFQSARKRKAKGICVLDDGTGADAEDMANKFHSLFNDVDGQEMLSEPEDEMTETDK